MSEVQDNLETHGNEVREGPGKRLKQARESRSLTVTEVARQLRLKADIIEALEADDYNRLSVPIYVRGYLRNYAALLGLPVDELLDRYHGLQVQKEPEISLSVARMEPRRKFTLDVGKFIPYLAILAAIVLAALVWISWQDSQNSSVQTETVPEAMPDALPESPLETPREESAGLPLPITEAPVTQPREAAPAVKETPAPVAAMQTPQPAPAVPDQVSALAAERSTPVSQTVSGSGADELRLELGGTSWVEIIDARNRRLAYRLGQAGDSLVVNGKAPFQILLGNAHGSKVIINNQEIDINPFIRGNVARFRADANP